MVHHCVQWMWCVSVLRLLYVKMKLSKISTVRLSHHVVGQLQSGKIRQEEQYALKALRGGRTHGQLDSSNETYRTLHENIP